MFNLRSLPSSDRGSQLDSSNVGRFSQFSVPNFRVPSSFIGDIGQPLAHDDQDEVVYRNEGSEYTGEWTLGRQGNGDGSSVL